MSKLAIDGGSPAVIGRLEPYDSITRRDIEACEAALSTGPLSGFLGGKLQGGPWVTNLEAMWADTFGVKHAIAVNSGTSGLLVACMAAGVTTSHDILTTPFTMSATAAAPSFLGARVRFQDIEAETFCLGYEDPIFHDPPFRMLTAIIATNLFGHPARLADWREYADRIGAVLIEDNAQSIFAMENGKYAGTIGHIGVFSLNVHKHIQVGEGGICVTDDDELAHRMRMALNHGELAGGPVGLNLRMTEYAAAMAQTQLRRGKQIVSERVEIAEEIIEAASCLFAPPIVREGCTHSYYMIPWLHSDEHSWIVAALQAEGIPVKSGYVEPLYRLPAFKECNRPTPEFISGVKPVVERVNREIITLENCLFTPTTSQLKQFKEAFQKVSYAYLGSKDWHEPASVCDSRGELQP